MGISSTFQGQEYLFYRQRNLLYNGAMQVAQRGTSTTGITGTVTSYYTADRWRTANVNLGTWTQTIEDDGPTGTGFRKSFKMLCTTADASPAAGDQLDITQPLEGFDLQEVKKGTSDAQHLTLSFWVKSNKTGTYIVELFDTDNTRHVCGSYSVVASGVWEKKVITFPPDTTGTFNNDNGSSLGMNFKLGLGSDFTTGTLATSWASYTAANRGVGQTNLAAATNNYWQITGVQLNIGPVATPFEFKSFGQELAECQRYYYRMTSNGSQYNRFGIGGAVSTTLASCVTTFPVTMRTAPTALEQSGTASQYGLTSSTGNVLACSAVPSFTAANTFMASTTFTVTSGLTAGNATEAFANNTTSAYLGWSAEL